MKIKSHRKIISFVIAVAFIMAAQTSLVYGNQRVVRSSRFGTGFRRGPCRCPHLAKHKKRTCYGCPCGCFGRCGVVDETKARYWDVYNATDKKLVFYTDDGASVTIAPGKERKIVRCKSFGFAIKSDPNLKALTTDSTKKHFITIFHDGKATKSTNFRHEWKKWQK